MRSTGIACNLRWSLVVKSLHTACNGPWSQNRSIQLVLVLGCEITLRPAPPQLGLTAGPPCSPQTRLSCATVECILGSEPARAREALFLIDSYRKKTRLSCTTAECTPGSEPARAREALFLIDSYREKTRLSCTTAECTPGSEPARAREALFLIDSYRKKHDFLAPLPNVLQEANLHEQGRHSF